MLLKPLKDEEESLNIYVEAIVVQALP